MNLTEKMIAAAVGALFGLSFSYAVHLLGEWVGSR
jgi:hypothetical protein